MRNMFSRAIVLTLALFSLVSVTRAVSYPGATPAGENTGGTFQMYFDNMYTAPCPMGQVLWGFTSSGVLQCVTPVASGLYITGQTLGDTLRFDGTEWIRNNLIFNDGTNVGIGVTIPVAKLDIGGTIKISGGTPGVGKVLTSDVSGLASWQTPTSSTSWELTGNSGTVVGTNFLGTTDDISLMFKVNAIKAGFLGNTADNNVFFGRGAGSVAVANEQLSGFGVNALYANVSGTNNTALGYTALYSNVVGSSNTALGTNTLLLSTGNSNVGIGHNAGATLTSGNNNIFIGDGVTPNIATTASDQLNIGNWIYGNSGSIGIGVQNPGAKLDIAGTIKVTDGTQAAGRVLMSDATGLAHWGIAAATEVYASGVIGGTEYYVPRFMVGGSGLTLSQIYDNSTNVGIGTSAPGAKLDIAGTIKIQGGSPGAGKVLVSDATGLASWGTVSANTVYATGVIGGAGSGHYLTKFMAGGSGITNAILFESGSYMGLNTTSPTTDLDINGQVRLRAGASTGFMLISDVNGLATWTGVITATSLNISGATLGNTLYYNGTNWIADNNIYNTGGNVGIGTSTPSTKLDVNGQIRLRTGAFSGLVLVSDTNGVGTWQVAPTASTVTATGITGGVENYVPKFGSGGTGLFSSQIYDDGTNIGISVPSPAYKLHVGGDAFFTGNVTVQGSLIVDKIVNRTVNNVSVSGSLLPDAAAPLTYRDIGTNTGRWNNLYLSGQVTIGGGSPGLGKFLISDANGLASWTGFVTATSLNISGAILGNTLYYNGTNWIPSNNVYNGGGNVGIGITGTAPVPTSKFEVWSGATTQSLLHFRGSSLGIGLNAARYLATGTANTGLGNNALRTLTTGYSNSAFGDSALYNNMQGYFNTAGGTQALNTNSNGNWNVALGSQSLYTNLGGSYNIALGGQALYLNSAGNNNTAVGDNALRGVTASNNTALGYAAGSGITTGSNNIAIGYGVQVNNNTASNQLNIGNWIYGSGGNIGIGVVNPLAKLDISGTIKISGGTPGLGKVLTSDASGLATWSNALSGATATGITGGVENYIPKFGTGGTGLYPSQIFDNGLKIGIGTGTNLTARLNIDSGSGGFSGLRFLNINATSTVTSTNIVGLGVNGSGEVVPISNGDVIVYDGITSYTPSPNPDNANREIAYDFNKYFMIPAKQSFVVTDGLSPGINAPYIGENAASSVCEWNGTYGAGMATCPTGDFPGSPYNSFTMSARSDADYGYQIGLAYRGDIQLMARSGKFRDGNDAGTNVDLNDYGSGLYIGATNNPAPWYKVITLPTNHMEWFYIDTGYTGQWNTTGRDGRIGIGTTVPNYGVDIRTTVGMSSGLTITSGSPGVGKVLTSDATGNATWQTPSGGGGEVIVQTGAVFTSILTSAATRSATSLADLGLATASLPMGSYNFKMTAKYRSAGATTGIGFTLAANGATVTNYIGQFEAQGTSSATQVYSNGTLGSTALVSTATPAANTDYAAFLQGTFTVTATGSVKVQFRSETTTMVTVQPGTNLVVEQIQ